MRQQRANFQVAPGLCHSVAPGSLQASVDERLEPAHHSKVLTSARQWEAQQIDIVCVRKKWQTMKNTVALEVWNSKDAMVKT